MSRREVRLKVDEAVFVARLNELLSQAQNLHVHGVGPQPEANRTFRQQFLAWMAEVERALEWGVDGEDVIVRLQTPRLISLVEDRVPNRELYRALEAELRIKTTVLRQMLAELTNLESANVHEHSFEQRYSGDVATEPKSSRVFVVHGRNAGARDAMFEFLRAIGLRPIEWAQAVQATGKGSPYIGEILDAAFERAQAVVVLMTPDEIAYLRTEYGHGTNDPETQPAAQARPNVLFEAGMAMGRDRTAPSSLNSGTFVRSAMSPVAMPSDSTPRRPGGRNWRNGWRQLAARSTSAERIGSVPGTSRRQLRPEADFRSASACRQRQRKPAFGWTFGTTIGRTAAGWRSSTWVRSRCST